jgi:hypothetical protein
MSRHRFKLVERIDNLLFEQPGGMPLVVKKRLLQKHECRENNQNPKRHKSLETNLDETVQKEMGALQVKHCKRRKKEDEGAMPCRKKANINPRLPDIMIKRGWPTQIRRKQGKQRQAVPENDGR